MRWLLLVLVCMCFLSPTSASCQDTLQVGYNSDPPCGSWDPYDFTLNPSGHFSLADSDLVVCRVSAEALGMTSGTSVCDVDIYAQWPGGQWQSLSLGCYALDTIRFLDGHCVYGTPVGHYNLRAEIDISGRTVTTYAELWLDEASAAAISTWGRVKALYR